jgi:hypothetical protein
MKKLSMERMEKTQGGYACLGNVLWYITCALETKNYNPGMSFTDAVQICNYACVYSAV